MSQELLFPESEISKLKIDKVIKRDGRIVAFVKDKIIESIFRAAVEVGGTDRDRSEELTGKVISVINSTYHLGSIPSVEEIQDIIEKVLVENGHFKTAKAYMLYRAEHARLREGKDSRIIIEDNIPYKILWRAFMWNVDHSCETIKKLNNHIKEGSFAQLVSDSEKLYDVEIEKVAKKIVNKKNIRIIIVAGPSSSGKTTTTTRIGESLKNYGKRFAVINVDNYYKDLNEYSKDKYGDYDFENPEALDLPLINEHLYQLISGKTIKIPEYNFKTGKRRLDANEFKLNDDEILLIDSLHGLYPAMTACIPYQMKFRFYIETLCQIRDVNNEFVRWTDLRMLRRMVRDSLHRGYQPDQTVGHWHYVRRSEKQYIVPFINKVDHVFNSALSYELPVYKKYLFNYFPDILKIYENDPHKVDAYIRAKRMYALLSGIEDLKDDSCIPNNSIIREFIGGSILKY